MRVSIFCFFLSLGVLAHATPPIADLILQHGNIYTASDQEPRAEAIAIKGEHILFVGSDEEVQEFAAESTRIINLDHKTVVPGLTDAHYHIFGVGEREMTLNLEGTRTLDSFLDKIKERADKTPP